MKNIRFYKDDTGWYSTITSHTKAQNKMILGADTFLEYVDGMTNHDKKVVVECDNKKIDNASLVLKRVYHDLFGAFYSVSGPYSDEKGMTGMKVYLCNVVHTVFGKHPKNIYIKSIS